MSILKYPSNGLNNVCKEDLSSCNSMLIGAANNLAYTVPSGFNYSTYMNDLKTTVNGYKTEMNNIINDINKNSSEFESAERDMTDAVKELGTMTVAKRDRLIKV